MSTLHDLRRRAHQRMRVAAMVALAAINLCSLLGLFGLALLLHAVWRWA
jgi:hypothetical protein